MADYVDVQPELLRWAVTRSGLELQDYGPNVAAWLAGDRRPTHRQLESFARRAMVPLGYLFLQHPPDEELPVPDYRTRRDHQVRRPSPNLVETIFEMQRRQDWMREYLIDQGHEELRFVGSARVNEPIAPLAHLMRETLELSDDWAQQQSNWEAALRFLRERIEAAGILVFMNGIVGNNTHRKLDADEFQGFVLIDAICPLIFVNTADYKVAQVFTIAHELAHVWIGRSALFDLQATHSPQIEVEPYCNAVAAEFLVPAERLVQAWHRAASLNGLISSLSSQFKVSPIVIARRAKDLRLMSDDQFFAFYNDYTMREGTNQGARKGGDFWRTQNARLGTRFGSAVIAAAHEGRISYYEAYRLTRLYGRTFDKYARRLQSEGHT